MKFKGAVIGILAAILVLNAITAGVLITESKRQTDIALKTAELTAIQTNMEMCRTIEDYVEADIGTKWFTAYDANRKIEDINKICEEIGIDRIINDVGYEGLLEATGQ